MATVNIPVGFAMDLLNHATNPTIRKDVASGEISVETSSLAPILKQLTIEEKVQLLSGANFVGTTGIDRLGIPPLKVGQNTQKPYDIISADNSLLTVSRYCEWRQRQRPPQWNFNTLLPEHILSGGNLEPGTAYSHGKKACGTSKIQICASNFRTFYEYAS